jgi:hypothetical protein
VFGFDNAGLVVKEVIGRFGGQRPVGISKKASTPQFRQQKTAPSTKSGSIASPPREKGTFTHSHPDPDDDWDGMDSGGIAT